MTSKKIFEKWRILSNAIYSVWDDAEEAFNEGNYKDDDEREQLKEICDCCKKLAAVLEYGDL